MEIGAGWRKQTKTTNKPYLFLKLELEDSLGVGQTVLCRAFKENDFKKSDKEPDLRIFLATDRDGNVAKANHRKPYVKKGKSGRSKNRSRKRERRTFSSRK